MCTCGSMKPGKTNLPVASITSAPGGTSKFLPMRVIVSFSAYTSACKREPTFTISPFRTNKPIIYFLPSLRLMNMNPHLLPVLAHLFPIFGHRALRLGKLSPSSRLPPGRFFHHVNAIFHRANVIAKPAAHTIRLAHIHARPRAYRFLFPVGLNIVRPWLHHAAIFGNQ